MKETAFLEADGRSAGQEILRHLWDRNVHQHFHRNHLLNHFLGQSNPLRMITSYLFEIHCRTYITFPLVYICIQDFSREIVDSYLVFFVQVTCPVPLICFDFIALERKFCNF